MVMALIDVNADVKAVDANGDTILIRACIMQMKRVIKRLIALDANIHLKNASGKTALSYVSYDKDIQQMLIDKGIDAKELELNND
jgi:ankyrin repeat protein